MKAKPHTVPKSVVNLFFTIGVISAIAFRVIIVFQYMAPAWVRPVWYVGVIGYFLFFLYRYYISQKRRCAVRKNDLVNKISKGEILDENEREVTIYLLNSLLKSKENLNYLIIFVLSFIVVAFDIVMILLK